MPTIKAVKTVTLSGASSLSAFKVVSGPIAMGLQTEKIDVSDMTNAALKEFVSRPQLEETEMNFQVDYQGTKAVAGGTAAVLTITTVDTAGASTARNITGFIISSTPVSVDVGGERRLLQDVVFKPDGSN